MFINGILLVFLLYVTCVQTFGFYISDESESSSYQFKIVTYTDTDYFFHISCFICLIDMVDPSTQSL